MHNKEWLEVIDEDEAEEYEDAVALNNAMSTMQINSPNAMHDVGEIDDGYDGGGGYDYGGGEYSPGDGGGGGYGYSDDGGSPGDDSLGDYKYWRREASYKQVAEEEFDRTSDPRLLGADGSVVVANVRRPRCLPGLPPQLTGRCLRRCWCPSSSGTRTSGSSSSRS